jgi:hypothetical protein
LGKDLTNSIKSTFNTIKGNVTSGISAARSTVANPYYIPDPWDDGEEIGAKIGSGINITREQIAKLQPVPVLSRFPLEETSRARAALKPDRAREIANSQLNLQSPELAAQRNKLASQIATAEKDLVRDRNTLATRTAQFDRKKANYLDRAAKLESRTDLSPQDYNRAIAKLNSDAIKLQNVEAAVKTSASSVKISEANYRQLLTSGDRVDKLTEYYLSNFTAKFANVAKLETAATNLQVQAQKFTDIAKNAREYANNLAKLDPNSELAKTAATTADRAEAKARRITTRAATVTENYRTELTNSGAKAALLNQQGLQAVKFAGQELVINKSGIENILYGDLKTNIANFSKFTVTAVASGFTFVATNATRAGLALGGLARSISQGNFLQTLKNLPGQALETFKTGGLGGLFNASVRGMSGLGQKALPFLPAPIAGAVGAAAIPLAAGAIITRDDIAKILANRKYNEITSDILAQDNKLKLQYDDRTSPLAQVKLSAQKLADLGGSADPLKSQLDSLKAAGQLTNEQFKDLSETIKTTGKDGKLSAESLAKFNAKLAGISGQEKPLEKGVAETLYDAAVSTPSALVNKVMGGVDWTSNLVGGIVGSGGRQIGNLLTGKLDKFNIQTFAKEAGNAQADRDAGYVIGVQSQSGKIAKLAQDQIITGSDAIASYRDGTAVDAENIAKLKAGKPLTQTDLDREQLFSKSQIERNNNIVQGLDKQIDEITKNIDIVKDPEQKELLKNQIKSLQGNRDALAKNTDRLKAAAEQFATYNLNTLPSLIRALAESKDPKKAIELSRQDFLDTYQKDAAGNATKFYKDIAQLRQDTAKYIDAVEQQYNIDNSASAEADAVAKLKEARDRQIILPDGTSGYTESIANRQAITDKIVKIQEAQSQRIIAAKNLEVDRIKVLVAKGETSQTDAQLATSAIAIDISKEQLAAKEKEIQEYSAYPQKVVQLEQEAAKLRVQIEEQTAERIKAIREREFELNQARYDLQLEGLRTLQSQQQIGGIDYIIQSSNIELEKSRAAIEKLYEERNRLTTANPELDNRIAAAEQKYMQQGANAQTQVFEAEFNLRRQQLSNLANEQKYPLELESKLNELTVKANELTGSILTANRELLTGAIDNQQQQLSNESKLVNNIVDRANIELRSAKLKLANLDQIQAYERQSLIFQQQSSALGLKSQQNQLAISKLSLQQKLKELELNRLRLDRDKSNSPESQAARKENDLAVQSARDEMVIVDRQGGLLKEQLQTSTAINAAKLKQLDATSKTAKDTASIDVLYKQIEKSQSVITRATEAQTLQLTAQTQALTSRNNILEFNTKQLENQSRLLSTAKDYINAIADARSSEINNLSELTSIESVKATLAKQAAAIKLSALNEQVKLEQKVLELNILQQQATLAQDRIKQQINEKQSESAALLSKANLEKLLVKGNLADPNEVRAAQLDYEAKVEQLNYTRMQKPLLDQQQQFIDFSSQLQRLQFQETSKVKLQSAAIDYSKTLPQGAQNELQNNIFNAGVGGAKLDYYQNLAGAISRDNNGAIGLPQFTSPYDPRSNYNTTNPNPEKLTVPTIGSAAFPTDLLPKIPTFNPAQYNVAPPKIDIQVQLSPELTRLQQNIQPTSNPPAKDKPTPTQQITVQMTNDLKFTVMNAKETKDTVSNSVLDGLYDVLKLVEAR